MSDNNYNNIRNITNGVIDLIAGSLGGCANVFVGQPLDTIKVKMQTFPNLYGNGMNCFKQTVVKEGFKGLYAGTTPALVANVAENSVLFCAYGYCQKVVAKVQGKETCESTIERAFSGFLAAFFSSFTLCPTELVKCKLQALRESGHQKIGAVNLTRQILKNEGIPGLFHGLSSTMAREMPGYFFFFGGYEMTKSLLCDKNSPDQDIGGVGGMALWTSIFPFDVVKSRIQVESSRQQMVVVLLQVFRQEGIRGLYKGLFPTLLRTFPSTGALFVAYEYSKTFMNQTVDKVFY